MSSNKKLFLVFAILFMAIIIYVMVDISSKTTFPGSRKDVDNSTSADTTTNLASDSVSLDSISH